MSEIKGQLLGMLLVVVVFGAIAGSMYQMFSNTADSISSNAQNQLTVSSSSSSSVTSKKF